MIAVQAIYKDNSIGKRDPYLARCCNDVVLHTVNAAEADRRFYLRILRSFRLRPSHNHVSD